MRGFSYLADSKSTRVSEKYSTEKGISLEDAIKLFLGSATYRVLNDAETGIYLEVFEYVYDMFIEEMEEKAI